MHHPLFLKEDNEGEQTDLGTTLVDKRGGYLFSNNYFHIPIERRLPFLTLLKKYNIQYVFSGHFHRNNIAHSPQYGVTNVTTSAVGKQLGEDKSGFRIVKVLKTDILHHYYGFENLPQEIDVSEESKI